MMPVVLFGPPPGNLKLTKHDIHVFCALLDLPSPRIERLAETLSIDEREKAGRFYFERDRARFTAGRGILREILGWLLRVNPGQLTFSYGAHGKPRLAAPGGESHLYFNLAHSDSLAVYAVSPAHEVGVDLERVRSILEAEEIAAHFFHEDERARWLTLPSDKRADAFFDFWTGKEALLKARGEGIGEGMRQIDTVAARDESNGSPWSLQTFRPALDYKASVAAKGRDARLCCWKWPEEWSEAGTKPTRNGTTHAKGQTGASHFCAAASRNEYAESVENSNGTIPCLTSKPKAVLSG
jgi:4'-phosphopantetheinyl transferase